MVLDLGDRQRRWLIVAAIAVVVVIADAVVRKSLPLALQPLLAGTLFAAGCACGRNITRRWPWPRVEALARAATAANVDLDPVADCAVAASEPDLRPSTAIIDRSIDELRQFPIFADILTSQLASVVALSDGAAHGILTGLAQVDAEVETLMSVIRTSDTGVEVDEIVQAIETKVTACGSLLAQFTDRQAETSRRDAALRVHLAAENQSVLRVVDGVRRIAQQSTILSFNIAIEAGHLGGKDNGFAFIADQVRRLAQDVDALSGQLSGQIGDIMHRVIVESQTLAMERRAAETADIATLRTALAAVDNDLRVLVGHQRDALAKVAIGSEAVAAPILAMMGSVQFQDITRQQIEQLTLTIGTVGTRIAGIADMLRATSDQTDSPGLSQLLDGLFSGYVMDGQRSAHLAATGGVAPAPAGLLIELF